MKDEYKEKYFDLYHKLAIEAPWADDDYAAWVAEKEHKKRCSSLIGCAEDVPYCMSCC